MIMVIAVVTAGCASKYNRGTYDQYLIPDRYEGIVKVIYNVKDAPPLQREGKYDVIPVGEDGTYRTSNPMYDYGTVIDQYYYVNDKGERTAIDPACVHVRGTGGTQNGQENTHYTEIEVTHSACGIDFRLHGRASGS
jgi:hypothetical protein